MTTFTTSTHFDLAIAGGGMVGMSLAIACAREGMKVALIERDKPTAQLLPEFDGRVSAIALGSKRLLNAIGAWEHIAPYAEAIVDIRVSDAQSPFFLDYDHREVGNEPLGWIVENRHIRAGLQQCAASCKGVVFLHETAAVDYRPDAGGADVLLNNGESIRASLLVAADGKHSALREKAGIKTYRNDYQQTAIVCTIAHTEPHLGLAQERFLPAGPFAVLPMQNNRSSLVWVEPKERVSAYLNLGKVRLAQEITERVGHYLGDIRVEGEVFSYPLSLSYARDYIAPRLALVGDAAHAIHPIAGQGVNLGFRDVAALHEVLVQQFALGLDIGSPDVLSAYERARQFANLSMIGVTDGLNRLFGVNLPPVKLARGLGLWGVSKLPKLRQALMRHAMGVNGEVPRLMRP